MSERTPHSLTTQSDRGAAAPDSHGDRNLGEGRSPQLHAVTDTLAWAIARIYGLKAKHNQEGETQ